MAKFDWDFNFSNVLQFYDCFQRHNIERGIEQLFNYLDLNATKLIADKNIFLKLPYDLVIELVSRDTFCAKEVLLCIALIQWQRYNDKYKVDDLLKRIRWNLITAIDFARFIRPLKVIKDDQYFEYTRKRNLVRYSPVTVSTENESTDSVTDVVLEEVDIVSDVTPENYNYEPKSLDCEWTFDEVWWLYRCNTCNAGFPKIKNIKQHMVRHTEPQLSCNECERKFRTRGELNDHVKAHTVNCMCDRCGKPGFIRYSQIVKHRRDGKCRKYKQQ